MAQTPRTYTPRVNRARQGRGRIWTMFYLMYYKRLCPFCGNPFQTVLIRDRLHLGSGSRTCSKCKGVFSDGSMEWPDMTPLQKRRFLFREILWSLGLLAVLPSAFLAYLLIAEPSTPEATQTLVEIMSDLWLCFGSILALFYLVCWLQITRSKARYANKQSEARI